MEEYRRDLKAEIVSLEQENERLRLILNKRSFWSQLVSFFSSFFSLFSFTRWKNRPKWSPWLTAYLLDGNMHHIKRTRSKGEVTQVLHYVSESGILWFDAETGERINIMVETKLENEWRSFEIRQKLKKNKSSFS